MMKLSSFCDSVAGNKNNAILNINVAEAELLYGHMIL